MVSGRVVATSDLLTVLPRHFVPETGMADRLVLRELPFAVPPVHVDALWHRRQGRDGGHAWLRAAIERDADEVAGRPLPGVELEVVDAEDRPQPPGCGGAIRLRAPGMAEGYLDNPQQTAQRFRDGWFYPGDIARWEPDGVLRLLGRADDVVNLGGFKLVH